MASFDPTRTQANPDITHDLAPVRSSPSITTIEETTLTNKRSSNKRGVSFDPSSSSNNHQTPVIKNRLAKDAISKPVLEEAVLEIDDDEAV